MNMKNNDTVVKPLQKKHKQLYMFKVGAKKIVLDLDTADIILHDLQRKTPIKIIGPICMAHEYTCKNCAFKCKVIDDTNNIEWDVITNYYEIIQEKKRKYLQTL